MLPSNWREQLRYRLDNVFAKGTGALIALLAVASLAIIFLVALVVKLFNLAPEDISLPKLMWMGLMRTLDSGTMGGDEGGWPFLFAMLTVTVGGIFVVSTLIGVLSAGIEERLESLRRGRSRIVESGHTVILGWSPAIITLVSELVEANASQRDACIVIMGDKDTVEMQEEITDKVGDLKTTRVVCRTGNAIEATDLQLVSLQTAKSIIVVRPDGEDPDSQVIKVLLAITKSPNRRPEPYHIVAEIYNPENFDVAKMVGGDEVELIAVGDLVARIMAQTCRQSGLSIVYTELLDFGGDEIYFKTEPALVGHTIADAMNSFQTATVMGIRHGSGVSKLNPPLDMVLSADDQLIFVAADDSSFHYHGRDGVAIDESLIVGGTVAVAPPEHTLILGWNWRTPAVIRELDNYVAAGSQVTIVASDVMSDVADVAQAMTLQNQVLHFNNADTTNRKVLESLDLAAYRHIIVMSYSDVLEPQLADARTLVTLLHLRDIANRSGHRFSIVSEMLDVRNRNLAEITQADDFIVSDRLISLMMAQVSTNKALNAVFADLFDADGAEVYLKPVRDYVQTGVALDFYTILESARRRNEIAIGYRIDANGNNKELQYGIVVNPNKTNQVTFAPNDMLIVLADS
ncbi:MAG: potassium transporter TrkA [Chloroflexia bacterium]|nr:potassium transporter TrkA [Chloroflexia bacterium]